MIEINLPEKLHQSQQYEIVKVKSMLADHRKTDL